MQTTYVWYCSILELCVIPIYFEKNLLVCVYLQMFNIRSFLLMCTFRILKVLYFSIFFHLFFIEKNLIMCFPLQKPTLHTLNYTHFLSLYIQNSRETKQAENEKRIVKQVKKTQKKYINKTNKNTRSERIVCSQNHPTRKTNSPPNYLIKALLVKKSA